MSHMRRGQASWSWPWDSEVRVWWHPYSRAWIFLERAVWNQTDQNNIDPMVKDPREPIIKEQGDIFRQKHKDIIRAKSCEKYLVNVVYLFAVIDWADTKKSYKSRLNGKHLIQKFTTHHTEIEKNYNTSIFTMIHWSSHWNDKHESDGELVRTIQSYEIKQIKSELNLLKNNFRIDWKHKALKIKFKTFFSNVHVLSVVMSVNAPFILLDCSHWQRARLNSLTWTLKAWRLEFLDSDADSAADWIA